MHTAMPAQRSIDRVARIKASASGRRREIFVRFGLAEAHFEKPNRPCPLCGGRDRFTFFAREADGGWFCRRCGHGDGIALVQRALGTDFPHTLERLEALLGLPSLQGAKQKQKRTIPTEDQAHARQSALETKWAEAQLLIDRRDRNYKENPVLRYLAERGLSSCDLSREIRWLPNEPYWEAGAEGERPRLLGHYPVMLARATSMDGRIAALHRTYLTADGRKAPVPCVKKLTAGRTGEAAIRLFPATNFLCLAEGIETALSVHALTGLPAWSLISITGFKRFNAVPKGVEKVFIYGDNDASFTGAAGAFELAARLRRDYSELAVEVRIPDVAGEDWNDVLQKMRNG